VDDQLVHLQPANVHAFELGAPDDQSADSQGSDGQGPDGQTSDSEGPNGPGPDGGARGQEWRRFGDFVDLRVRHRDLSSYGAFM
jgi:hypothetical protein